MGARAISEHALRTWIQVPAPGAAALRVRLLHGKAQGHDHYHEAGCRAWATLPPDRHASWALRLTDVRGFARHVANIDPETEVPPAGILPPLKRAKPYAYSDAEISALLAAALALPPANGLRRWTYHCLFGLIAVTGMRLSETIGLQRGDVDLDEGVVTVRQSKFGKSRLVPLHRTTREALLSYSERRDAHLKSRCGPHFFVTERGGRLLHQ